MESIENIESIEAKLNSIKGLDINIRGLVLIYKKTSEAIVKMRLPKTDDHVPIIKITSTTQGPGGVISIKTIIFSIPLGGRIEITHFGALPAPDPELRGLLKMNDFHSRAKFKPSSELIGVSGFVSITNAIFTAVDETNNFERWKVNDLPPGGSFPQGRRRGKREITDLHNNVKSAVTGEVFFDDLNPTNNSTKITVSGISQTPFDINLAYVNAAQTEHTTHIVDITNLCEEGTDSICDTKSDFLEYYTMLDRVTLGGNEFDFIVSDKGARAPCNVSYFEIGYDPEQP